VARYVFDCETDGFLEQLTTVHSLVIKDLDTGKVISAHGKAVEGAVRLLMYADLIVGHNVIKFDLKALAKVYPCFTPQGVVRDTMVLSRLLWPEIANADFAHRRKHPEYPVGLVGKHTLEAWGRRLKNHKGDYAGPWDRWSQTMQDYCEQDVEVTEALWLKCVEKNYAEEAIHLEHDFATIIAMQEEHGVHFDVPAAEKLYVELAGKRATMLNDLQSIFQPWWTRDGKGETTPKRDNSKLGYTEGAPFTKVKLVAFNPASRKHIANRFKRIYGWQPKEFTETGEPKVDEDVLSSLSFPEAKPLAEYFLIQKRIGQLAEGDAAWLKLVKNGRIHGAVITNGAVTRRCTHNSPNLAQCPRVGSPYGEECRSLFIAPPGYTLVGVDASGLELRCLAHYMHRYDDGKYAAAVIQGRQEDGTDVHTLNTVAIGLEPKTVYIIFGKTAKGRDVAKTFIYAFLYGAGDEKIGVTIGVTDEEVKALREHPKAKKAVAMLQRQGRDYVAIDIATIVKGAITKDRFLKKTPALKRLREAVADAVEKRGSINAIDGGRLNVRHKHAALNTLLQSAGAIAMKKALVVLYQDLTARGWVFGREYAFVLNIHDEVQAIVRDDLVSTYAPLAADSIRQAGEQLGFRCPLAGEAKPGRNWAETH
jgi:DNA polymerase I-like protein with 3'-5' exonuclease and polymerase domains